MQIAEQFYVIKLARNDVVYKEGDDVEFLFYIVEGKRKTDYFSFYSSEFFD